MQKLNNILGYRNTDKVLVKLAKAMQENFNKNFMLTRLFSSDFAVLMPQTSLKSSLHQVQKVTSIIAKTKFSGIVEYIKDESLDSFILRA